MVAEEGLAEAQVAEQERRELLREHVVAGNAVPRLTRELGLRVRRRRDPAEVDVGQVLDLVVVVEDDPPVAADAEVPPEQVAGEDVRDREVADRVAVLQHRGLELLGRRPVEIDVERGQPPLHVAVVDDKVVAVLLDHRGRVRTQLAEQLGGEALEGQRQRGELERVGQPPHAVDVLDHLELRAHGRPVGVLPGPEDVLDHLEDVRIRREREHEHHLAAHAGGLDERVLGVVQVLEQVAVEERLALLAQPDHRVEVSPRA